MPYPISNQLSDPLRAPRPVRLTLRALTCLPIFWLAACSEAQMSLGANDEVPNDEVPDESLCNGGVQTGNVYAQTQADVDALLGCEEIEGDLHVEVSAGEWQQVNLAALGALRLVHGTLHVEGTESLLGLEALEQVSNLELVSLPSEDLTALANLKSVAFEPLGERVAGGQLSISECQELRDLHGLENLRDWRSLNVVANPALESLAGLQSPRQVDDVFLYNLPMLRDVSALAPVVQMRGLQLYGTRVEDFSGFELRLASSLGLDQNSALTDLDGLSGIYNLEALSINDNDSLVRVGLPALVKCHTILINGNDALQSVPAYPAGIVGEGPYSVGGDNPTIAGSVLFKHSVFEIGNNAQLTHVVAPLGYVGVQQVAIWGNPNLTALDLGPLLEADHLIIADNAELSELQMVSLNRVGDLSIVSNPSLSTAPFTNVQTFSRNLTGNLD